MIDLFIISFRKNNAKPFQDGISSFAQAITGHVRTIKPISPFSFIFAVLPASKASYLVNLINWH